MPKLEISFQAGTVRILWEDGRVDTVIEDAGPLNMTVQEITDELAKQGILARQDSPN